MRQGRLDVGSDLVGRAFWPTAFVALRLLGSVQFFRVVYWPGTTVNQQSNATLGQQCDPKLLHHQLAGEAARILTDDGRHAVVLDPVQQLGETLDAPR